MAQMRRQGTYPLENMLALRQLAAWQAIADDWPVKVIPRGGQLHLICVHCRGTILPVADAKRRGYQLTTETITAAVVMHLRQLHQALDPEGTTDGSQDTETPADPDRGSVVRFPDTRPD